MRQNYKQRFEQILRWREQFRGGTVAQCAKALGLSHAYVYQIARYHNLSFAKGSRGAIRADVKHEDYYETLTDFQAFCRERRLGFTVVLTALMKQYMQQGAVDESEKNGGRQ